MSRSDFFLIKKVLISHVDSFIIHDDIKKSTNVTTHHMQTLQNNVLRVCINVRLHDRMIILEMHTRARILSIEQRRRIQLLNMMFIYETRHDVERHFVCIVHAQPDPAGLPRKV